MMSFKDKKILEYNQHQKSDEVPFIICTDLKCIIEKIGRCKNNPLNSSKSKVSEHISPDFSMSTMSSFRGIENELDMGRGKDCMKNFCEFLRENAVKIINFKKKNWRSY